MADTLHQSSPLRRLNDTLRRLSRPEASDSAPDAKAESDNRSGHTEMESLRVSLRYAVDSYRYAAIGLAGVFGNEKCQSIGTLLAHSILQNEGLTSTVARVTRDDVRDSGERNRDDRSWQSTIRPKRLNQWPARSISTQQLYRVDYLDLLQWLRTNSEFSLLTFDNLGDVIDRLPMARRLDGLVIINSGRQFDIELMNRATAILKEEGVRVLGQIRNIDYCA